MPVEAPSEASWLLMIEQGGHGGVTDSTAQLVRPLATSVDSGWLECRHCKAGTSLTEKRFASPAIARSTGELYRGALGRV
jgi:hypothetical protein